MRIVRLLTFGSALALATPLVAGAQDAGKTGLTMGYPTGIGLIWHASDSLAIRPSFSFGHSSNDSPTSSSGWSTGIDVSALFYVRKYDNVRTYVSPRFSFARSTATVTSTQSSITVTTTGHTTGGAGAFGAQYSASPHFALYGEVGLQFSHHTSDTSGGVTNTAKGSGWGTIAGVGIIFYP
jgi:hypothetical protein